MSYLATPTLRLPFLVVYSSPLESSVVGEKVRRGHVKATPPRLQTATLDLSVVVASFFLKRFLFRLPPSGGNTHLFSPLSLSVIPSPIHFPICALHSQFPLALLVPSDRWRATCFRRSPLLPSATISQQDAGPRSLALSKSRCATCS